MNKPQKKIELHNNTKNLVDSGSKAVFLALVLVLVATQAFGQKEPNEPLASKKIVQFSGLVLAYDSAMALPGVVLQVKGTRRGTYTNIMGFFSMPVLTGDTVLFNSMAFKNHQYVVPDTATDNIGYVVMLDPDTIMLETITILPLPSEAVFKEMFLALELPDEHLYRNMNASLAEKNLKQMALDMPMDGAMNHQFFMQQHAMSINNRATVPTLSLLNPFAWAELIRSIRRGDFKKKKWEDD